MTNAAGQSIHAKRFPQRYLMDRNLIYPFKEQSVSNIFQFYKQDTSITKLWGATLILPYAS